MEHIAKPRALTVPLFLFLFLLLLLIHNHTWLVHSRNLASSPSPAPATTGSATNSESLNPYGARGRKENSRKGWGSLPATCHSKCNQCRPCVPVEVSIRTMAVEQNQYYPIAWKCMCRSNIFSP